MNYPVWFLPTVGGGLLVALIAITHVFVSHFAVGGGLYLIFSEKKGLRENDEGILGFTKRHAKFFLLITMVYGSITGVGIWWIIALINPAGTSLLIHNFVFGWATEWVFFVLEIAAAFVYFYMFGKMDSKTHLKVGWVYFISAWLSLFLINGIVDFMLTPGNWVENPNFWVGFFNPSFFPSLFFRTFVATLMAGVYGYLTASFAKDRKTGIAMTSFSAKWTLVSLVLAVPSGYWYLSALPEPAQALVTGQSPTIAAALNWGLWSVIGMFVIALIAGIIRPSLNLKPVALIAFICAFLFVGAFEWTREAARRPYVINEVMYSNMIFKDDVEKINETGFLQEAVWVTNREITDENQGAAGKELFIHQCYACHTIGGFNNDIVSRTASMSYNALVSYIQKIHEVRYFMPPFAGTEAEVRALAAFIAGDIHGKEIAAPVAADTPVQQGAILFDQSCSACHAMEDLQTALAGWEQADIRAALDDLPGISEDMPPFEGTGEEKDLLTLYLFSLNNEIQPALDGSAIFDENCTACHGPEDMPDLLGDRDLAAILEMLDQLNELVEDMPPFEGTPEEKAALADYLNQLNGGAK